MNLEWAIAHADATHFLKSIPDCSFDSVVTDPPYPEINRAYGRLTESEWSTLMKTVVGEVRRVLKPTGSAVFILQPNSEFVGRMRPWLWDFMSWICHDWNMIQDVWWWNPVAVPTVHCQRTRGLMRPSVKACVWAGSPSAFRNQDEILWAPSDAMKAVDREDRALRRQPSGQSVRKGRLASVSDDRGGVTPFNLIPMSNTNSSTSGGAAGHGAATPLSLSALGGSAT